MKLLLITLIFSTVTGTVFAIVAARIENREIKIEGDEWYDDF